MKVSRQTLKDVAPWALHAAHLWRRAANQIRYPVVASAIDMQARGHIMSGPFKGLRAPHSGISPGHYTQILGIYETALIPAIEAVIARQPGVIIDVGSHWGYYALGLALRCPRSRVVAYEMDHSRAQLLRKYRALNGIGERVEVRGACSAESLASDLAGIDEPFLLMDVEGAEDALLDPVCVPPLRHAEIIVELHETVVPGITNRLRTAFAPTHRETLLQHQEGAIETVMAGPVVEHPLLRRVAHRLIDEGRETAMSWLHLQPRR